MQQRSLLLGWMQAPSSQLSHRTSLHPAVQLSICVPPAWQAERTSAASFFGTPYQDEVEGAQHIHEEFTPLICEEGILQALVYLGVYLLQPERKCTGPSAIP